MSSSKARFLSILAKDITTVGKVPSTNIVLPASGVTAATYGSATQIPVLTIDTEGRVTSASTTSVAGVSSFGYNTGSGRLTINTADGGSFTADVTLAPFTTTTLAEGTNQYFTTARARSSISATGTNLGYNSTTGVLSYTQGNTDTVAEGATNLYYTSARARGALSYTTGSAGYNSTSGVITIPGSSTDITEGTKLFYTDARARAALSGGTGVSYNSTTGVIAIGQPVATTDNVTFGNVTVNGTLTSDDITSTNITVSGNATITGNLTVSGTTTTVNSTTVSVADINIEVARNATTAAQANGAGLTVTGPTTPATLTYSSADDRWNLNKDLNISRVYGNLTGAVTGNASTASTLQTARSITITGDGSWTVNFDGSANVSGGLTLANSGVTAGTYGSGTAIPVLTIDAKGRVTTATTTSVTIGDGAMTVTAGSGLTGGGQVGTANQTGASSVTISHADTSSVADQAAATNTFVSGITFDTYGHVQTITRSSPSGFLTAESDTLATVTGRGASTSTAVSLNGGITIGNSTSAVSTADDYSSPLILKRSSNDGKGALLMQGSDSIGTAIEHGRSNSASHWGTYLSFLVHDDNVSDVIKSLKEKLRINGSGVIVGGTTARGSAALTVSGTTPIIAVSQSGYGESYLTTLGARAGAQGFLILGNNGQNEIRAGRTTGGGYLDIFTNNTVDQASESNGTRAARFDSSGNTLAYISARSPIFYDLDDTTYYVNPNSSSNIVSLNLAGSGTSLALNGAGSNIAFRDQDLTWTGYVGFSGNTGQLNFPGRNIEITAGYNASVTISTGASGYNSGQVIIPWGRLEVQNGSIRSPIYYDYNNTAAWLDPSVTSGTMLATGASSDTLGYNPSYGIYIGGINGRYVYSGNSSYTGPIFWNGSAAYTIYHSGNLPAEADTLASVTARGSSTSTAVTLASTANHYSGHFYYDAYAAGGQHYPHFLDGSSASGAKVNWRLYTGGTNSVTHYWDTSTAQFDTRLESSVRVDAPIFYDRNNTAYYVDPNGTSRLYELKVGGGPGGNTAGNLYIQGNYDWRWIAGYSPDYGVGNGFGFYSDTLGYYLMSVSTSGNWYFGQNNHNSSYRLSINGTGYASSDFRAPIFYDSDNTSYYVDPNNTTVSAVLAGPIVAAGGLQTATSGYTSPYNIFTLSNTYNGGTYYGIKYVEGNPDVIQIIGGNNVGLSIGMDVGDTTASSSLRAPIFYDSADTAYYGDFNNGGVRAWRNSGYSGGISVADTGGYLTYRITTNNHSDGWGWQFTTNDITSGSGTKSFWVTYSGNNAYAAGSMRAPIFYDSDNTSFYCDPNGTTRLSGLVVGYANANSTIDMYDSDEGTRYIHNNSGTIGFLNTSGNWRFRMGDDGNVIMGTYQDWLSNQIRSSIFYDHSDTGYYTDPNGTSTVNLLNARSLMVTGSTTDRNVVKGMPQGASASYNNTVTGAFKIRLPIRANDTMWQMTVQIYDYSDNRISEYKIGSYSYSTGAYNIAASFNGSGNATARTVRIGNEGGYDCVWIGDTGGTWSHPVIAVTNFVGGYANASASNWDDNWDISVVTAFGTVGGTINPTNRVYAITADSSMYSPIYYDSNDTGYYLDPAGSSLSASLNGPIVMASTGWTGEVSGKIQYHGNSWYLVASSYFHFRNTSGLNTFYGDPSGNTWSETSSRAPIFYDSNNTAYFTDPASRSRQASIDFGDGGYYIHGGDWGMRNTTPYGWIQFGPANTGHAHIYTDRSNFYFNAMLQVNGGSQMNTSDMRANIFYDQQDTAYYLDPNSYSNVWRLNVQGNYSSDTSGSALYIGGQNVSTSNGLWINFHSDGDTAYRIGKPAGAWTQPLEIRFYTGIRYKAHSSYGGHRFINYNTDSTRFSVADGDDNVRSIGNFYAPIMYDYNNTGYYVDPNSVSVFNDVRINDGNVQIRSNNVARNTKWRQLEGSTDIGISFYNAADTWCMQLYANNGGEYGFLNGNWASWDIRKVPSSYLYMNNNNSYYLNLPSDNYMYRVYGAADTRSPIFYDLDNTGYYLDPNSTSNVYNLQASNYVRASGYLQSSGNVYIDGNYGYGIVGTYASTRYQGVFAMGDSYKLAADGTGTGTLYGLAWSHPNAGGVAANLNTHGLLAMENGTWLASLTGSTRARDDMRAPIFYDRNDSGYYCDPNDTSVFWHAKTYGGITVNNGYNTGYGINLYSGSGYQPTYGIVFAGTGTYGTHGSVTSDWSTFFTMNDDTSRGWVFRRGTTNVASISGGGNGYFNGNVTAYSDIRVKTNIENITNAVDKVNKLRGVTYDRIDDPESGRHTGVIAQEVLEVLPEAVGGSEEKGYYVAYGNMVGLLIEAIKEQDDKIKRLEALVETLINKLGE